MKWETMSTPDLVNLAKQLSVPLDVCVLVSQSCPTLCDLMDYSPTGSSVHRDSPGKNTGALLQGIFPTQESNQDLLHCGQILYHLSHQEALVPPEESPPKKTTEVLHLHL